MSIESNLEREEEILLEQFESGEITRTEYNDSMKRLQREAFEFRREEDRDRLYDLADNG
jgi:hypothetical protein